MRNETRQATRGFTRKVALLNGVPETQVAAGLPFSVAPTVSQRMHTRIQESSELLRSINIIEVPEQSGERVGIGMVGTIAGRTDTRSEERAAHDPSGLDNRRYECKQTNFDAAIGYDRLDTWARFPDFQVRVRNTHLDQQGRDWLAVGFNGTHAAADTNREAYPRLQDVNRGWLQALREESPEQVVTESLPGSGVVRIGAEGDFKNLDALVISAAGLLNPLVEDEPVPLVVLCSSYLVAERGHDLYTAAGGIPSEQLAAEIVASRKQVGGLPLVVAPFFPRKSLLITPLSNLSIYLQDNTHRRRIVDNSKRDQVEFYESINMAYVVEDPTLAVLVDNIDRVDVPNWNNDELYPWRS
jgi:P2 family phage major capsid protein